MRPLLLLLALVCAAPGLRAQPAPTATLELALDPAPAEPFVGEMVLATLRGLYVGNVALEELAFPPMEGWSWLQLGPPEWSQERVGQARHTRFALRLAFFPAEAGALTLPSIRHDLTFATREGRVEVQALSPPVTVEVRPPPPLGEEWWMPARSVTLRDEWAPPPDRLGPGEWTVRTVTLEVAGVPPEGLPPPPPMYAGGLFTFADPEERGVRLTPEGPVSTAVWRYRMQPQTGAPADLDDIPIPWFDTGARAGRSLLLEGRHIAFAASAAPREPGPAARWSVAAGGLLGGVLGLGLLLPRLGMGRSPALSWPGRIAAGAGAAARLLRAERAGDGAAARAALLAFLAAARRHPGGSATLAELDRRLFGPEADAGAPSLEGLTRAALAEGLRRARRAPEDERVRAEPRVDVARPS